MKSYDLYGLISSDLEKLAQDLGQILGVTFSLHESSYRGGDYYRSGMPGQEEFILQSNYDQIEDEVVEPEFPTYAALLYVGPTDHSAEIKDRIEMEMKSDAVLLRHRVL